MSIFDSHPRLRWAVPTAVVAVVASATFAAGGAGASAPLPPRTAAQLLVDVQQARLEGMSGTIVQTVNLGLPDLSGIVPNQGASSQLSSLVTGSHTLRVWYAGPHRQRIALLGASGESDIVRNGSDLWIWSSEQNSAVHHTVDVDPAAAGHRPAVTDLAVTPEQAAEQALAAVDPSTVVTTDGTATVAGRAAYELVLRPRDEASLVREVRIAVDGEKRIPLRVQVFSKRIADPAVQVGFTHVDFSVPEARQFEFTPPPGSEVTEPENAAPAPQGTRPADGNGAMGDRTAPAEPTITGTAWTTVMITQLPAQLGEPGSDAIEGQDAPADQPGARQGQQTLAQVQGIVDTLPKVSGSWGSGRLFEGTLFTAVITDDGRVAIGSVVPERLYQALAA